MAMWVLVQGNDDCFEADATGVGVVNFQTTGALKLLISFDGGVTDVLGATTLTLGTWNHVGWTYDGLTAKLYVNGVLDGSGSLTPPTWNLITRNAFGLSSTTYLDAVVLSYGLMTAGDMAKLYASGVGVAAKDVASLGLSVPVTNGYDFDNPTNPFIDSVGSHTLTGSVDGYYSLPGVILSSTVQDGDGVASWKDSIGNVKMTPNLSTVTPSYVANGQNNRPVIRAGAAGHLLQAAFSLTQPFTIISFCGNHPAGTTTMFGGPLVRRTVSSTIRLNSGAVYTPTSPTADTGWHMIGGGFNAASSFVVVDGVMSALGAAGPNPASLAEIVNADHGELAVYNHILTQDELNKIASYGRSTWGTP
jgi:hypothetical protein